MMPIGFFNRAPGEGGEGISTLNLSCSSMINPPLPSSFTPPCPPLTPFFCHFFFFLQRVQSFPTFLFLQLYCFILWWRWGMGREGRWSWMDGDWRVGGEERGFFRIFYSPSPSRRPLSHLNLTPLPPPFFFSFWDSIHFTFSFFPRSFLTVSVFVLLIQVFVFINTPTFYNNEFGRLEDFLFFPKVGESHQ